MLFDFTYIEKNIYGKKVIENICNYCDTLLVVFTDINSISLAHNWFLHIQKLKLEKHVVMCCVDMPSFLYATEQGIPCIYYSIHKDWKKHYTAYAVQFISYLVAKYNVEVFYSETDIIILREFFNDIKTQLNNNIYVSCFLTNKRYDAPNIYNSQRPDGIILYYNKQILNYIKNTFSCNPDDNKKRIQKILLNCLPLNEYYYTNNTFCEYMMQQKIIDKCIMVHYNIVKSLKHPNLVDKKGKCNSAKISLMKDDGVWLLT